MSDRSLDAYTDATDSTDDDPTTTADDLPPPRATAHVAVNAAEDAENDAPKAGWVATVDNWGGVRVYIKNAYSTDSRWHTWRGNDVDWALSDRPVLSRAVSDDTEHVLIRDTQRNRVEAYPPDCWNIRVPRDKTPDEQRAALVTNLEHTWLDHADALFPVDPAETVTGTITHADSDSNPDPETERTSNSTSTTPSRRDGRGDGRDAAANDAPTDDETRADRRERYEQVISIVDHHTWGPANTGDAPVSPTMDRARLTTAACGSAGMSADAARSAIRAATENDDLLAGGGRVAPNDPDWLRACRDWAAEQDPPERRVVAECNAVFHF